MVLFNIVKKFCVFVGFNASRSDGLSVSSYGYIELVVLIMVDSGLFLNFRYGGVYENIL